MENNDSFINQNIIRDMSEGVMEIGLDGTIRMANPACCRILDVCEDKLIGNPFARCFFDFSENDAFNQTILDAIYDPETKHDNYVQYYTGEKIKQIHITTSYLNDDNKKIGIIAVFSDISEIVELRDAVSAMEKIKELNSKLEIRNKLISDTFGRYLSDEIVAQLLDTPEGLRLGGKKQYLTVLMSDLRGFTQMSERMDPKDLLTMLNHYLGQMTEIIIRHNGTIIEFIGDAILALFGAPTSSDRHAEDAVSSALEMQKEMVEVNKWNHDMGYPELSMGIGINTGDMIVGNIGSEKRVKYGVTGAHVNLCGRVESYTTGGQVLISPYTMEAVSERLDVCNVLEVLPKGLKEPICLYQISGIHGLNEIEYCPKDDTPVTLSSPVDISFRIIDGKHTDGTDRNGQIVALSKTKAILSTDCDLKQFDNILIDLSGNMYCKVLRKTTNNWELGMTAKSPDTEKKICEYIDIAQTSNHDPK